jgi:putative ABC transport system permease protein
MNWPGAFFPRLDRRKQEDLLDKELRFHLEEQIRENIAAGMSPERARREALLEFGGIDQIKEECRDVSPTAWLDALVQDVKFSFRSLGKSRGFTLTALATIAIGIGFNAAIYSYLDGILLRPVGLEDADRLVWIYESGPGNQRLISTLNYLDLAEQNTVFEYTAPHRWGTVTVTGAGLPTQTYCESVGIHFTDIFTGKPLLGRFFQKGDDQKGRDHVVIITYYFWQSQFSGDPNIIGRPIMLDGEPYTVIGVNEKGPAELGPAKMMRPLVFPEQMKTRDARWLLAWGRLKPGVSMEQALAQVETIGQRLRQDHPSANNGWKLGMESAVADRVPANVKQSLYLLMASVGTVMLIACANLANLTLARGAARSREVAVRAALGAGRGRLVRQFLTESLILSAGGGILGLGVAYASLAGLNRLVPSYYIPINQYVQMDERVLLFILVLAIVTGLLFGLYPALKGSRPDLRHALSQGGLGSSSGRGHQRFRQALVVLEVALAIILLFGGGLLLRSFAKLKQVDIGFNTTNVITGNLPINNQRFATEDVLRDYLRKLAARLNSLPGARDAALTSGIPLRGITMGLPYRITGATQEHPSPNQFCSFKTVSPSYFRLLDMRLLRGRLLAERDVKGAAPAAVINETMAKRVFGTADPIGQSVILPRVATIDPRPPKEEIAWEVVGVVANERLGGLRQDFILPMVYVTTDQCPLLNQSLLVRTLTDPALIQRAIPPALTEVNPDQAVADIQTLDQIKAALIGKERLDSTLLGIFASAALLLSALGLYGVISYSVAQRTREIGIRSALGATSSDILWLTFRGGLILTGVGLGIGLAGSVGVGRILASMLFEVEQFDALTLGAIVAVQVVVALLACFVPARRALKVNPVVALRSE